MITLQRAIEKSSILLSQYWKNEWLNGSIIISYFGGSNNIFADCIASVAGFSLEPEDQEQVRTLILKLLEYRLIRIRTFLVQTNLKGSCVHYQGSLEIWKVQVYAEIKYRYYPLKSKYWLNCTPLLFMHDLYSGLGYSDANVLVLRDFTEVSLGPYHIIVNIVNWFLLLKLPSIH